MNTTEIESFYTNRIVAFTTKMNALKKKRNCVTFLRILSFCLTIYLFYKFLILYGNTSENGNHSEIYFLYGAVASILLYFLSSITDTRILTKISRCAALIQCSKIELEYLAGDYTHLKTGAQFVNPSHPYTNDLDVFGNDSIYQEMNRAVSKNGEMELARMLETNCKDIWEIQQRQKVVTELKNDLDFCHNFRAVGSSNTIGELNNNIINQWVNEKPFFKHWNYMMPIIWISNLLMAGLIIAAYVWGIKVGYIAVLFLIQLLIVMYRAQQINLLIERLGAFIKALSNYIYLIEELKDKNFQSEKLRTIKEEIFGQKDAVKAFRQLKRIQDTLDSRINILLLFLLNGLYMRDFHTIYRLEKWKQEYLSEVPQWIHAVSLLDAYVSMANYSFNHPQFIMPKISDCESLSGSILAATDLGHPMLHTKRVVTNNFAVQSLHDFYIITGANMAGKSTFLRTVGINMILALSGNPVFAKEFTCTPIQLFTSMRTTDNLAKGTSYFHAELLRLKSLMDMAESSPLFIILDEMLKGTNSKDKLNGSMKFLEKLLTQPICGIVATHDLALGDLKNTYPDNFYNICFEIEHTGKDIQYDYKLKEGVSKNMNASILLEQMGLI